MVDQAIPIGWTIQPGDALAWLKMFPSKSAALCLTSPPYEAARTYGLKETRRGQVWVDWFAPIVVEMARVVDGLVCVNVAGQVQDFRYSPIAEWLVADLTRNHGLVMGPSPYAWVRSGIPGSGSKHYHRRNWEGIYCFARPESLPLKWSDNTAFGSPPKCPPGGDVSNRKKNGRRITTRDPNVGGEKRKKNYQAPSIANPGNVIHTLNGGGLMGHDLAHETEAPMNLSLAERFVRWFCPPGGLVLDPFVGSGTTGHAAFIHGRNFAGCDVRASQVDLAIRRLEDVRGITGVADDGDQGNSA